jgi:hypothetical protein
MGHGYRTNRFSAVAICAVSLQCSAQTITGYHIGNSLTWDSHPDRQTMLADLQSTSLAVGYHINCNRSLDMIAADPTETCVPVEPDFGFFQEALSGVDLDYITFQPYWTETSTLTSDLQVIEYFDFLLDFNPANDNTTMYLYQAWGPKWFMNNGFWFDPVNFGETTATTAADEYFVVLYQVLTRDLDRPVRLIPAAQVIIEIRDRIWADEMPGVITLSRFYRDDIHLSDDLGQFAASITAASVINNCPPFGMHRPWIEEFGTGGYTTETYLAIESAVWDVVSAEPRTGVSPCLADTNRDGLVTPQDFTAWIAAYNIDASIADQNHDGRVTPRDFTAWIANFNNGCE